MDSTLLLQPNLYPRVTPAGAYYAVSNKGQSASRTLLGGILQAGEQETVSRENVLRWAQTNDIDAALNLLYRMQRLEFLYGEDEPDKKTDLLSGTGLPNILMHLSDVQKALLVDQDGFYFSSSGFNHEAAEEIAVLASEAVRLYEQRSLLIKNNLNIYHNAVGICDPSGQSELTFFPLYIGDLKFILVTGGVPQLHKDEFVSLVRALYQIVDSANQIETF